LVRRRFEEAVLFEKKNKKTFFFNALASQFKRPP